MRILFSCPAQYGHFLPLTPLAQALAEAGHEVAFATARSLADQVAGRGFRLLPAGLSQDELDERFAPYRRRIGELPVEERRRFQYAWRFATVDAPAKAHALREHVESWEPDLVVHEAADLAGPIVSAATGVPCVRHGFGRAVPISCLETADEELEPLWHDFGIEPEPLCGSLRSLYLDICPPILRAERFPEATRVRPLRPRFPPAPDEQPPAWLANLAGRDVVYVTLGTVNRDVEAFRPLLDALADLDCAVVATVGKHHDPGALGALPPNTWVERYISQSFLLPHCAVAVGHGGSGSTLAALAHGIPLLVVPQGADQFENAAQCAAAGAGRTLMPGEVTPAAVHDAVRDLLTDPSYAASAGRVAAEIAAMPEPADVVSAVLAEAAVC